MIRLIKYMHDRGVALTVTPSMLADGQDAFVYFSGVANPSPQDYIAIACGPTTGLNDYIDAVYVGPCNTGPMTDVRWFYLFIFSSTNVFF